MRSHEYPGTFGRASIAAATLVNDIAGAITELETAAKLEPDSPSVRYTLARAYQRAGRAADAKRERTEFLRLERLQQEQRGGANAVGGPPK